MSSTGQIEAYTDGQCPLCQWSRARVEPLDRDRRLVWLEYHDPESLARAAPHTARQLADEMHVRLPDGSWHRGYWAWLEVLRLLPRWRLLAVPLSAWPLTRLGPALYKQVA